MLRSTELHISYRTSINWIFSWKVLKHSVFCSSLGLDASLHLLLWLWFYSHRRYLHIGKVTEFMLWISAQGWQLWLKGWWSSWDWSWGRVSAKKCSPLRTKGNHDLWEAIREAGINILWSNSLTATNGSECSNGRMLICSFVVSVELDVIFGTAWKHHLHLTVCGHYFMTISNSMAKSTLLPTYL